MMIFPGICSLAQHGSQADLLLKQAINYLIRNIFKNNAPISPAQQLPLLLCLRERLLPGDWPPQHVCALAALPGCVTAPVGGEISEIGVCMLINPRQANAIMFQFSQSKKT